MQNKVLTGQLVQNCLQHIMNSFNLVVICWTVPIIKVHLGISPEDFIIYAQKLLSIRISIMLSVYGTIIIIREWIYTVVQKCCYLYAFCWGLKSFNEALCVTGSQIPDIYMPSLEPWGDGFHPPVGVAPDMGATLQKIRQLTWQVDVGLSGHSLPQDLSRI